MKYLLFFLIIFVAGFLIQCQEKKEIIYYENGKVKLEVPKIKDMRNGLLKEYYPNGNLKLEVMYVNDLPNGQCVEYYEGGKVAEISEFKNGKRIGNSKLFFESGQIAELTFYDSQGRPIDFINYKKNGDRSEVKSLMVYSYKELDTLNIKDQDTLFVKLGNTDSSQFNRGNLVITSQLTKSNLPMDTLAIVNSNNKSGFLYNYTATTPGENAIIGVLIFTPTETNSVSTHYAFEYTFFVKNSKQ